MIRLVPVEEGEFVEVWCHNRFRGWLTNTLDIKKTKRYHGRRLRFNKPGALSDDYWFCRRNTTMVVDTWGGGMTIRQYRYNSTFMMQHSFDIALAWLLSQWCPTMFAANDFPRCAVERRKVLEQ